MVAAGTRISAVVLSYNSARYIERCIDSAAAAFGALGPGRDELFVVENGSRDASPDILRSLEARHPDLLRVFYLPQNTGTTVSRNMALRRATGRYVLVMDSDLVLPVGPLEHLTKSLDEDPTIGILVPRLTWPDGRYQMSTDVFPTAPRKLRRFVALKSMERRRDGEVTLRRDVDYAISAFWLLRREVVERVGLFDENIFYSPEDVDYCLRVWEAGFRVVIDPSVSAIHDAQEISRGFPLKRASFSHAKGLFYLFYKHRYALGHARLYRRIGRERAAG